ncbi:hypothetical protein JAAARDRAFT_35401 [Jaapia argillacea MUCL 33604]|uniref:Queuosine 5'-phosphate N-glycosylase/hydrolase n=1 Tax=Jaapia argillacea MUCL 33604 TaxID=933084 RepID=A0A067PV26_9AGAM|nr:hypothetical protein JAAARDRAFT_35401 [Jaapia argillacea MUCL 33604]
MSTPSAPYPPSGGFMNAVRDSSRLLRQKSNIKIESDSIKRLLVSPAFTTSFKRVSGYHGLAFPLNFVNSLAELNFLSILSLLNFASGYRVPLHKQSGRGAWDSIRALLFSMFLGSSTGSGDFLSGEGMKAITDQKVSELMGLSVHTEKPHETIIGITVGELGGPAYELVKLVTKTLNETGNVLVDGGYKDLGCFVLEALKEGEKVKIQKGTPDADVEVVLERLVRAFPGFRDMGEVDGQPIYCFKKALFLICGITVRFGSLSKSKSPTPPFPIPDITNIPICADNVIPSLLIYLGVIDLSESPESLSSLFPKSDLDSLLAVDPTSSAVEKKPPKEVPKEGPILTNDQAFILRAAAIDTCELIVEHARTIEVPPTQGEDGESLEWIRKISLLEIDTWLWAVAKDRSDYRKLERFVLRNTVFF